MDNRPPVPLITHNARTRRQLRDGEVQGGRCGCVVVPRAWWGMRFTRARGVLETGFLLLPCKRGPMLFCTRICLKNIFCNVG